MMPPGRAIKAGFTILIVTFMAFPIFAVVIASFSAADFIQFPPKQFSLRWYDALAHDPRWTRAAFNSIIAGLIATVVTVATGLPAAVAIVRGDFRGRGVLYGLVTSPMIVPQIITGIGIYYLLAPARLTGSVLMIGLSQVVLCLPVFVVIMSTTLGGFDVRLEDAAVSLGASRLQAVRSITLPMLAPGIIAGSLFAFLTSFDEMIIALLLGGPGSSTLPVSIWNSMIYQTILIVVAAGLGFLGFLNRAVVARSSEFGPVRTDRHG